MQTAVLYLSLCYIVLILLFSTAFNTSLIYCFVIWCLHTNKRRLCSSTLSGHPSSSFFICVYFRHTRRSSTLYIHLLQRCRRYHELRAEGLDVVEEILKACASFWPNCSPTKSHEITNSFWSEWTHSGFASFCLTRLTFHVQLQR